MAMRVSDRIRALARDGLRPADIARQLGIRYQHAYGVLKADGALVAKRDRSARRRAVGPNRPPLTVDILVAGGFEFAGYWRFSATQDLELDPPLPKGVGVYAFATDGIVQYVGVATMGLEKRMYSYSSPGSTQRTSQRLNVLIKRQVSSAKVDVYVARPPDLEWNGLPIHGSAGLELGLIQKYSLPWNQRGMGRRVDSVGSEVAEAGVE